jgi:hypothetical protein
MVHKQELLTIRNGADTNDSENISDIHRFDDAISDTLDMEHDVFNKFIPHHGDDPTIDVLDLIKVEGMPQLRKKMRILLEQNKS